MNPIEKIGYWWFGGKFIPALPESLQDGVQVKSVSGYIGEVRGPIRRTEFGEQWVGVHYYGGLPEVLIRVDDLCLFDEAAARELRRLYETPKEKIARLEIALAAALTERDVAQGALLEAWKMKGKANGY
jgi:hypothetical protein